MIVAEFCDDCAVLIREVRHVAFIIHLGDRGQLTALDQRSDVSQELTWREGFCCAFAIKWGLDFTATDGSGELNVPAGIVSTGAATEGNFCAGEAQIYGVKVNSA